MLPHLPPLPAPQQPLRIDAAIQRALLNIDSGGRLVHAELGRTYGVQRYISHLLGVALPMHHYIVSASVAMHLQQAGVRLYVGAVSIKRRPSGRMATSRQQTQQYHG